MNATEATPPTSARRRYLPVRFGLRALLFGITCIAVACAILGSRIREGYRQRALATRLEVDWSHYAGPFRKQSTLPSWIEGSSLSMAFRRVCRVILRGNYDEQLSVLAELGKVHDVSVYDDGFGERELETLLSRVEIESLYIESAQLSRGRLPCLRLQRLSWLCVARTQFSNPAIDDLPTSLTYLDVTRTRITDEGLPAFIRLTQLRTLILCRTPTTAAAVQRLRHEMPWCEISWEPLQRSPHADP